jgi:FtsH-binding integral membrane protein
VSVLGVRLSLACAELPCNDVSAVSILLFLLPLAALIALVLAWPLARFLPRRRVVGWILAIAGFAGYVWFSGGPMPALAGAFAVAVIGFAFIRGHTVQAG